MARERKPSCVQTLKSRIWSPRLKQICGRTPEMCILWWPISWIFCGWLPRNVCSPALRQIVPGGQWSYITMWPTQVRGSYFPKWIGFRGLYGQCCGWDKTACGDILWQRLVQILMTVEASGIRNLCSGTPGSLLVESHASLCSLPARMI